jgi:hypothetical protein
VLSPFILLLSDLLSGVLVEALGVELELVSWLCARADDAASARANTDNAVNLIGETSAGWVYAKVGDAGTRSQRTTPRRRANRTSVPRSGRSTKSRTLPDPALQRTLVVRFVYAENDEPQPQVCFAFGFLNENPLWPN